MLALETADVRNQRQIACALDRDRQLTLMASADAAQPARQDLAMIGNEAAEGAVILVIDEMNPRLAERTALGWSSHGLLLVLVFVLATASRGGKLFFAHRWCAELIL